ncbi:MAG: glucose 1-dehydrogenase [Treponema sp.]|jgi:3-oxoacyl-[acyl-carrier protein] reductase|nr:glucose 1-dehydrogenase [Treponema sp.]
MELNLEGKTVFITGGGGGLGSAITKAFAAEGADVAVNYIVDEEQVFKFVKKISADYGVRCIAVKGDISVPEDMSANVAETVDKFGKIDILINNAGVWPTSFVVDMDDEEWDRTLRVNLNGPFYLSKRFVKHLIARKAKGKIVNIASQAAFHGSTSGHAHYAASKGGLVSFTVSLAREVAQYGINVNAIAPGMARTPMNSGALSEREDDYIKRIPLGRIADPSEVANVIVFLASEKADYITGATVDVSGGMLMR